MSKHLGREARARGRGRAAAMRLQLGEQGGVVRRIDGHRHRVVILRGGPQHRRTADVDVLDGLLVAAVRPRDRLREWVEVDDEQIDRLNVMPRHHGIIDSAAAQQSAVNLRMQRLDAAIHDLGKSRVARYLADWKAALREQARGASGGQDLHLARRQCARELDQTALVGYRQQRPRDGQDLRDQLARPSCLSFLRSVPRLMPRIPAARLWLPSA